jgi:hypothetical protein
MTTTAIRQTIPEATMSELLNEALTAPGKLGNTYTLFYNYSFMNQVWLMIQGVNEPVGPFGFWKKNFKRIAQPKTAKTVLHPVFVTKKNKETGEPELDKRGRKIMILVDFTPKATVFRYSDTVGPDVEWPTLPDWDLQMALSALEIEQVPFEHIDGNTQGYSLERQFAISPVAAHPLKTTFHELAHIVLGHTKKDQLADYVSHRGIKEFQAEATAYLLANELDLASWDASESRAYIQTWLGPDSEVTKSQIRAVFGAVNKILLAGRPARSNEE